MRASCAATAVAVGRPAGSKSRQLSTSTCSSVGRSGRFLAKGGAGGTSPRARAHTGGRKNGTGGSTKPNLKQEFNAEHHARGVCSMARTNDPNSANSQFFIMFTDSVTVDGVVHPYDEVLKGQYTVVGHVISGMEVVDAIQRGEPPATPDVMTKVTVQE